MRDGARIDYKSQPDPNEPPHGQWTAHLSRQRFGRQRGQGLHSSVLVAALALSAAIAGPAFAAPPTYSGTLLCDDAVTGEVRELNSRESWTKKEIAAQRKFRMSTGFCAKGSFDTSAFVKNPRI